MTGKTLLHIRELADNTAEEHRHTLGFWAHEADGCFTTQCATCGAQAIAYTATVDAVFAINVGNFRQLTNGEIIARDGTPYVSAIYYHFAKGEALSQACPKPKPSFAPRFR
jgi:hypothetical protein